MMETLSSETGLAPQFSPHAALPPEEQARAYHYALVSRLFFAPPDRSLAEHLGAAETAAGNAALGRARQLLRQACQAADLEGVRSEYEELFIGTGKSPVALYTSYYAASRSPDRHLLSLRQRLVELGVARPDEVVETEDHISGVCDVMRWLIESRQEIGEQREFFERFLAPAGGPLCDAIVGAPASNFYRAVAGFAAAFFRVEQAAFGMEP